MVKRLPIMWETQVRSLGQEDPLEKAMATHSSTLAWKIPWMDEPGGVTKSRTRLSDFTFTFFLLTISVYQPSKPFNKGQFSPIQLLSHVQLFATPWTAAHQASLSITNFWSLLKLMSIESVMSSNHLILCRPLLLPSSVFPRIGVFSSDSTLHIKGGQRIGASASTSVLPVNIQD